MSKRERNSETDSREDKVLQQQETTSYKTLLTLLDATSDFIILIDTAGKVLQINQAAASSLGKKTAELIGKAIYDYFPPETAENRGKKITEVMKTGRSMSYEEIIPPLILHNRLFPIQNQEGVIDKIAIFSQDITKAKRIEKALADSEGRFAKTLQNSQTILFCLDMKTGEYEYISPYLYEHSGYSAEEYRDLIDGDPFFNVHPEDLNFVQGEVFKNLEAAKMSGKSTVELEYRRHKKNGEHFWIKERTTIFTNERGELEQAIGSITDITDLKNVEADLIESRETARALLNASTDYAFLLGPKGNILSLNEAAARYMRMDIFDAIGVNIFDFIPSDIAESRRARLKEVFHSGKAINFEDEPIGRYFFNRFYPVFNREGKVDKVAIYTQDITQRRLVDKALAESEERYRTLQENLPIGIFRSTPEGKLLSVNPAAVEMTGHTSASELIRINISELYKNPTERQTFLRALNEEGFIAKVEVEVKKKDNSSFWGSISVTTMYDNKGVPLFYDGILEDITSQKEAEAALRRSEEQLKRITDNMLDMVSLVDLEGKIRYASPSHSRILGYKTSEIERMSFFELLHPQEKDEMVNSFKEKFGRGMSVRKDIRCRKSDGEYMWLESVMVPVFNQKENPEGVVIASRDISEHKTAEMALKKSEANLKAILENTFASISLYDRNKIIVAFNQQAYESTKKYRNITLEAGKSYDELFKDPGVQRSFEEQFKQVMQGEIIRKEMLTDSGRWFDIIIAPVYVDNEIIGASLVNIDITERKQAEEALKRSEENLRSTLEATTDGIWDWNVQTGETHFSPQYYRMLGYEADEFPASYKNWVNLLHPEEKAKTVKVIQDFIKRSGEVYQNEFRARTKDGGWKWIRARGRIVEWDKNGKPRRLIGNHEDITESKLAEAERRRFENQLQQMQKMESLGVLAGGVAHDFNNLLQSILGNASFAILELPKNSKIRKYIEEIHESAEHASELTKQMLAYSGRSKLAMKPIDISGLIRSMNKLLQVSVPKKIALNQHLAEHLPAVTVDETQIKQVLMNLAMNAAESMKGKSGKIDISSGKVQCSRKFLKNTYIDDNLPEGEYVYFQVSDNGAGMEDDTKQKIFDPFFSTKSIGRGLGLAAVMGIVRGHKGAIEVESKRGAGSRIRIYIPVATEETASPKEIPQSKKRNYYGWKVLVVDDEELVRRVAKRMLEQKGFEVLLADNGKAAINLLQQLNQEIDIILLDLTMPEMSGRDTYSQIRKIDKNTKVIIISGYDSKEIEGDFNWSGVLGFIQKPFRISDFISLIEEKSLTDNLQDSD